MSTQDPSDILTCLSPYYLDVQEKHNFSTALPLYTGFQSMWEILPQCFSLCVLEAAEQLTYDKGLRKRHSSSPVF